MTETPAPRTGTWDDWLATRAHPEPAPRESAVTVSAADVVALVLRTKTYEGLDLGLPAMRDGLRDLMEEFERDTAGARIEPRIPAMPGETVNLSVSATSEGKVRLLMTQENGPSIGSDYRPDKAAAIASLLLNTIRLVVGEEGGGD